MLGVSRRFLSPPHYPPTVPALFTHTSPHTPFHTHLTAQHGLLYIADSGNHRILEVEVDAPTSATTSTTSSSSSSSTPIIAARVRRIFGSPRGDSGPSVEGTTAGKVAFNKPMGLAVDFDGVLTVADR